MRYNFIELLVRIAKNKYFDSDEVDSIAEGFRKLMEDVVLKNFIFEPWQEFREKMLWNLGVDDVYVANRDGVKRLY